MLVLAVITRKPFRAFCRIASTSPLLDWTLKININADRGFVFALFRTYGKGRILAHTRGKRNSKPNTSLVQIEGVANKEEAQFYLGKVGTIAVYLSRCELALPSKADHNYPPSDLPTYTGRKERSVVRSYA